MDIYDIYKYASLAVIGVGVAVFCLLHFVSAPYGGRHGRDGWGPTLPSRWVWVIQESPSVLVFALVYFLGERPFHTVPLIFFLLWQAHYVQRTYVFPFLMRMDGKRDPLSVGAMAFLFTSINGALNAWAISSGPIAYDLAWLHDPRFLAGVTLFAVGYWINRQSDAILRSLRAPGETDYKIPRGGLFRWVTSPNYFGELVEWIGWALTTWSLAGLAFAIFTAANLVPRARSHHRWYLEKFPDYPGDRKIIVPFLY